MEHETTHQYDREEKRMRQIVSAERLCAILDKDGDSYDRPKDFGPNDEWFVEAG